MNVYCVYLVVKDGVDASKNISSKSIYLKAETFAQAEEKTNLVMTKYHEINSISLEGNFIG